MNFNHYYQSFNNEMYRPYNGGVICVIFRLDGKEKVPYTKLYDYSNEFSYWESFDPDKNGDYSIVMNEDVVEFIPVFPTEVSDVIPQYAIKRSSK